VSVYRFGTRGREGKEGQTILSSNPHQWLLLISPLAPLLPKGGALTLFPKRRCTAANAPLQCPHMGALHTTARKGKCPWSGATRTSSWSGLLPRNTRKQLNLL